MVEKLQSIEEEEEEEEETKGELTGKAHSVAGRGREMIIFRLHQEQNITQQHCREGDSTERGSGRRRLETYREIIMMSPVLPPKGWDQKKK